MLILTRRTGQSIDIHAPDGTTITLTTVEIKGNQMKLGIDAPKDYAIIRDDAKLRRANDGDKA